MNPSYIPETDTVVRTDFWRQTTVAPDRPAFVMFPLAAFPAGFCQQPATFQQAIYLMASRQAEAALRAIQDRRRQIFARGIHRWN